MFLWPVWWYNLYFSSHRTTGCIVQGCQCGSPVPAELFGAFGKSAGSWAAQKTWGSRARASRAAGAAHLPYNKEQQMEGNKHCKWIWEKKKISDLLKKKIGWIFFLLSLISVYPFHWSQSLHLWLWVTWFSSSSTRPLARSTQTPQYPSSPPGVCCAHPMKGCISLKSTETSTYHRSCLVRRIPQLLLKERITACVGVRRTASHFATQLHIKSSFSWRFPHNQLTLIKSAVNNTCSLLCSGLAAAPLACVKGTATALPPNLNISVPVTILIIF